VEKTNSICRAHIYNYATHQQMKKTYTNNLESGKLLGMAASMYPLYGIRDAMLIRGHWLARSKIIDSPHSPIVSPLLGYRFQAVATALLSQLQEPHHVRKLVPPWLACPGHGDTSTSSIKRQPSSGGHHARCGSCIGTGESQRCTEFLKRPSGVVDCWVARDQTLCRWPRALVTMYFWNSL